MKVIVSGNITKHLNFRDSASGRAVLKRRHGTFKQVLKQLVVELTMNPN